MCSWGSFVFVVCYVKALTVFFCYKVSGRGACTCQLDVALCLLVCLALLFVYDLGDISFVFEEKSLEKEKLNLLRYN